MIKRVLRAYNSRRQLIFLILPHSKVFRFAFFQCFKHQIDGILEIFVVLLIALINPDYDPDGLIRRRKVGRFVGFDRRVQRDFFKNVALCRAMLAHDVASLAQWQEIASPPV